MTLRKLRTVAAGLLLLTHSLFSHAFDTGTYEALIARGMTDWQIPGLATAVIEDGEIVFSQGFGSTALTGGEPITPDTPFAIASTTKAMVVAGLLLQVDAGNIALDDPIAKWLPELRFGDPALANKLTLRDLLAHRTGMPSTDFLRFTQGMSIEQQLQHLPYIDPVTQPRTRLIYQNTMYELAGLVLERLTGQFWGDYLTQSLWRPIGMTATVPMRGRYPDGTVYAQPNDVLDGELQPVGNSRPPMEPNAAGSVWSTATDMSRWAQFLLRGGVTESGERLISEQAFAEWFEPAQLAAADDFYPVSQLTQPRWRSYALGWFQQDFNGQRIDFHTGSLSGLVAILGLDRDANRAVIVLANRDHAELRHALLWHVMDTVPTEQRRDWHQAVWQVYADIKAAADARWAARPEGRVDGSSALLANTALAGQYHSDAWGDLTIAAQGQTLEMHSQSRSFTLQHWHGNTFLAEHPNWTRGEFLEFRVDPAGNAVALTLRGLVFEKQP